MGGNILNYSYKVIAAYFFCLSLFFAGCDNGTKAEPQKKASQVEDPQVAHQTTFNTTDKSFKTNGNALLAFEKIQSGDIKLEKQAVSISAAALTKTPYSTLGKLVKIKGDVIKVEEIPLAPGMTGSWAEILLLSQNQNNPLGQSTIDFLYYGDISNINAGDTLWCTGYFVGTYESQNAMGGMVEGLAFIGNKVNS